MSIPPTEIETRDTDRPEASEDALRPPAELTQDEAWNLRFT